MRITKLVTPLFLGLLVVSLVVSINFIHINPVCADTNLIANGGFETGDLTNWTAHVNYWWYVLSSPCTPHSGTYCLEDDCGVYEGLLINNFTDTPTSDISSVSCWECQNGNGPHQDYLVLYYTDGSSSSVELYNPTATWEQFSITPDVGKTANCIGLYNNGTGINSGDWIDDVAVIIGRGPAYSDISYSTSLPSASCEFACKWYSDLGLSGFIFGTNNTGTWVNETWEPLVGTSDWTNVTEVLNSTMGARIGYCWWCNATDGQWTFTGTRYFDTVLLFNHDQIWQGDLWVTEDQSALIENCTLTVVDGDMVVYGNLTISNATIRAESCPYFERIIGLYGTNTDFTMIKSTIIGSMTIGIGSIDSAFISNSIVHDIFKGGFRGCLDLLNSSFHDITKACGTVNIDNSSGVSIGQVLLNGPSTSYATNVAISGSNITAISLRVRSPIDLELETGHIDHSLVTYEPINSSLEIDNSKVGEWNLNVASFPSSDNQGTIIRNSTIKSVSFDVGPSLGGGTTNMTLNPGFIDYKNIYLESEALSATNITMENSTIESWSINIDAGARPTGTKVQIENSTCNMSIKGSNGHIAIINSHIPSLSVQFDPTVLSGTFMTLTDTTVDSFGLIYLLNSSTPVLDLVLQEGYYDSLNLYGDNTNQTVIAMVRTRIDNWLVENMNGGDINISNSTLSFLWTESPATISVTNSNVSEACIDTDTSLILNNSTLSTLYANWNTNLTAINSTIGVMISDPPYVELENSILESEIVLPLPFNPDSSATGSSEMSASTTDTYSTSLPENVTRLSKYLEVNATYHDFLSPIQVKMYYNESQLKSLNINETNVKIYFLNTQTSEWQSCLVQGVNETGKYVWTNVTDLSCYVLGCENTIHDICMQSVNASKSVVGQGYNLQINVNILNQGGYDEDCNISILANTTSLFSFTNMTLTSGNFTVIPLLWNTTGSVFGNYTISAYVEPVPGEVNILDNNLTCTIPVHIGVPGDVSSSAPGIYDKVTNMKDIAYLVMLFNTRPTSPNWNPNADVNNDGVVNMKDIAIAILHFNQHE